MYPKRRPPKATKSPMTMAGAAEPGTSAGFFIMIPMVKGSCLFYGEGMAKEKQGAAKR